MQEPSVDPIRRVYVADDGSLFCSGLREALSGSHLIEIVGAEHANWRIPESIRQIAPDVAIIPLGEDGVVAFIRQLRYVAGESVAVLVVGESGPLLADSIIAGASGVISWRATASEVSLAVMAATSGELPRAPWPRRNPEDAVRLSSRELEVMRLAAEGLTNASIARALHLSEATVKTYWRRIFKKLGAHDRTMAATKAMSMGILPVHAGTTPVQPPVPSTPNGRR